MSRIISHTYSSSQFLEYGGLVTPVGVCYSRMECCTGWMLCYVRKTCCPGRVLLGKGVVLRSRAVLGKATLLSI